MLAFEVEYLLGRVYAGDFRDRSQPEWPPHPARLFSALTAAYFEGERSSRERAALLWLEKQGPPYVRASPPGIPNKDITAFVPTNYPGDLVPELRSKQPRAFPAQAPAEPIVSFIWPNAEPEAMIQIILDELAGRVAYLGKACSLVRMCVTETAPDSNFIPDPSGAEVMRTVRAGRLSELETRYNAGLLPSIGAQQRYRKLDAGDTGVPPVKTCFGDMLIFRRVRGTSLPVEATVTLTNAVRIAMMSNAGESGPIPEIISGHGSGPHCVALALPFAGEEHADGRLMGFAVVLPHGISLPERRRVLAAAGALERRGLYLGKTLGSWEVELDTAAVLQSLRPDTWTRPSERWSTVTPILLDRFPKKKGPSVEQVLEEACLRIGLPAPVIIEHQPYSELAGVPPVPQFRLLRKARERARWGVHATLEFPVPVRGPVVLGAGRFFGLGLLKPQTKRQDGRSND